MRVAVAAVLAYLLIGGTAVARQHIADARLHLQRANELAGQGKCAAAIPLYNKAYDKLRDPIVLFNRAECFRRLGENAKAAADYRGFLAGFPAAPNRVELEARIATLERPAAPPPPRAPRTPAAPSSPPPLARTPTGSPQPPAPGAKAPTATAPPAPTPTESMGPMPFLPPPPASGDAKTLVEAPRSTEPAHTETSHGSRWWLWTSIAVVAVGGGVAGYFLLRPKDQVLPPTTLGNYRF
jgi:hypothetical protein